MCSCLPMATKQCVASVAFRDLPDQVSELAGVSHLALEACTASHTARMLAYARLPRRRAPTLLPSRTHSCWARSCVRSTLVKRELWGWARDCGFGHSRDTLVGTPGKLGLGHSRESGVGHSGDTLGLGTPGRLWVGHYRKRGWAHSRDERGVDRARRRVPGEEKS